MPAELGAFLRGEIDSRSFRHLDHLRVAYEMLARHSFADAAAAYSAGLKRIAAEAGNPGAYHETMTIAFLSLIAERMTNEEYAGFDAFIAANADLLDKNVLAKWYRAERLASAVARQTFVLPDREHGT